MGREVKRVPLDFNHPMDEVWAGYLPPHDYDEEISGEWVDIDPPTGDGYQMWENTSEGSPISPVFESQEALIDWMIAEGWSEWAIEWVKEGQTSLPSMIAFSR